MSETAPKSGSIRYLLLSFVLLTWIAWPVAAQNTPATVRSSTS